jgi:hypothetical protein
VPALVWKKEKPPMNLFDKIKDTFSNEDEKAAAQAAADQAASDQAAADSLAAQNQAAADAANAAAAAEADAQSKADAELRVAEQNRILEQAAASEQAAAAAAAKPTISLAGLQAIVAHDSDASVATGDGLNLAAGLIVEQALASVVGDTGAVDGALGTSFKAAYARFQESLGYSGADADGTPGKASLQALADRTGAFIVAD